MASVTGRVNERAEALVAVRLMAGREVECLVDTGASCALVLPQALVDELGLPVVGYERDLRLAGGAQTRAPLALAQIEWLGEVRSVEVIVQEDYIVGTDLLEGARLVIDYRARALTISRGEDRS